MSYKIKNSTLEQYKTELINDWLSINLINSLSPEVIKSRALKLKYWQKPGMWYISPIVEKAIEECKKDFQVKDFWTFNNNRDNTFIINKIRELKGLKVSFNLDINKMKVNYNS